MICSECNSSVCFCVTDSQITNSGELDVITNNDSYQSHQSVAVLSDDTNQMLMSPTRLSHRTDSQNCIFNDESLNSNCFSSTVSEHVLASPFQRPSCVDENDVDMYVLNTSNVYETSMPFSQVLHHYHSDHSNDTLQFSSITSNGHLSSSMHDTQQVSNNQVTEQDTKFSSTTSDGNQSSIMQDSQQVSVNQVIGTGSDCIK